MRKIVIALTGVFVLAASAPASGQSALKGSRSTMQRQNAIAQGQDYTFLRTSSDVRRFADKGLLVRVRSTSSLTLDDDVSFPYARPAVKLFAERLSIQYKNACGQKLVVTSLTRPLSRQPRNASDLSVHPAGMALDIRMSKYASCRRWLENTLVSLEKRGLLDATRERNPAHYHVAIFPAAYENYVANLGPKIAKVDKPSYASIVPLPSDGSANTHRVRAGDNLWTIARRHGVTVTALKQANDLRTSKIKPGQVLAIPQTRSSQAD